MINRIVLVIVLLTKSGCFAGEGNPNNIWLSYSQDANVTNAQAMLSTLGLGKDEQRIDC